ncbi:MAG: nitronate monooxygenase [Chloroflexi bacterium]|nr:nitronate monooxygenase [Chloroflexota bacterium]
MAVGVSTWRLARAVAMAGEKLGRPVLGVVSGTGLSDMMIRRLQQADPDTIRALTAYDGALASELLAIYGSSAPGPTGVRRRFAPKPEVLVTGTRAMKAHLTRLTVAAAFVEVTLAKSGHSGPVGINILEKLQLMHLPMILGAMLADVDYVLVGAGIPHQIPAVLQSYAARQTASYKLDVAGTNEKHLMTLDPRPFIAPGRALKKPRFFAIISHHALAMRLAGTVEVDGFIIEGPVAGGHNAPARGKDVDEAGQPMYGERDQPDLARMRSLRKPFWLAGSYACRLAEARALGAVGIQVGSAFALCDESGMDARVKRELRGQIAAGALQVTTSAIASPTGFPFQVAQLEGTLSEAAVYRSRKRICNIGHLVEAYAKPGEGGGGIGFRCPGGPVGAYVRRGGLQEKTAGVVCLCNGLASAAGFGRVAASGDEPMTVTLGKSFDFYHQLNTAPDGSYRAEDVVRCVYRYEGQSLAGEGPAGVQVNAQRSVRTNTQ